MSQALTVFLSIFGGGSIAALTAGSIVWLTKTWISEQLKNSIKHEYEKELELYKALNQIDLERRKSELQEGVERFKSELAVAAAENQVKFAKLHENVAEVVAELYAKLFEVLYAFADYVSPYETSAMGEKQQRRSTLDEKLKALRTYFYPRRIYVARTLAEDIAKFEARVVQQSREFWRTVETGEESEERDEKWMAVSHQLHTEATPLFDDLEDAFRRLLGVDKSVPLGPRVM